MVYSSKDFESLWFLRPDGCKRAELERLTKAEGLPKNISIEEFLDEPSGKPITAQSMEFLLRQATRGRADYPTFDKW